MGSMQILCLYQGPVKPMHDPDVHQGVNAACQNLFSIGQQVVRKLDPALQKKTETAFAFATPPEHQATVCRCRGWGGRTGGVPPSEAPQPPLSPPGAKPVQRQLSGFTDAAAGQKPADDTTIGSV
ncbi:unnamed protein product [Boreogadus saida]